MTGFGWQKQHKTHSSPRRFTVMLLLAVLLTACSAEKQDWKQTVELNTQEAYRQFLEKHPHGKRRQEAADRLEALAFAAAKKTGSLLALDAFLHRFPEGKLSKQARADFDARMKYLSEPPGQNSRKLDNWYKTVFLGSRSKELQNAVTFAVSVNLGKGIPAELEDRFRDTAACALGAAGLTPSKTAQEPDVILKIHAGGWVKKHYYTGGPRFTEALIKGTITLLFGEAVLAQTGFRAYSPKAKFFYGDGFKTPGDIFQGSADWFWRDVFQKKLVEITAGRFGRWVIIRFVLQDCYKRRMGSGRAERLYEEIAMLDSKNLLAGVNYVDGLSYFLLNEDSDRAVGGAALLLAGLDDPAAVEPLVAALWRERIRVGVLDFLRYSVSPETLSKARSPWMIESLVELMAALVIEARQKIEAAEKKNKHRLRSPWEIMERDKKEVGELLKRLTGESFGYGPGAEEAWFRWWKKTHSTKGEPNT